MKRRQILQGAGLLTAGALAIGGWSASRPWRLEEPKPSDGWNRGSVAHIVPTVSHEAIRVTVSLDSAEEQPELSVSNTAAVSTKTDLEGQHWQFELAGLPSNTEFELTLKDAKNNQLCDPWTLRTFPAPDATPERMRLLVYTCAGGSDLFWTPVTGGLFLPTRIRTRLLMRALEFEPDAVIANGDHIYWDLDSRYGLVQGMSLQAKVAAGTFDRSTDASSTQNEGVIKQGCGPQIAGVYGNIMRSTPCWFIADDHDYFENDETDGNNSTFPPEPFKRSAAELVQHLYYPKPLPVNGAPADAHSLQYGTLLEALLYDCRIKASTGSADIEGHLVAPQTEAWLHSRMKESTASHVVNVPGLPVLWTAGKWMEWYPDHGEPGPKENWPTGWLAQHDRLVRSSVSRNRSPLWLNGDLHCSAVGKIHSIASGDLVKDCHAVLCGTIGTGPAGFPSFIRGQGALPSETVRASETVPATEKNGFAIIDITPNSIAVKLFGWQPDDGVEAIASLEPFWEGELA